MSLSQHQPNRIAYQLNELRTALQNGMMRRYGPTEFTRDVIEHALTQLDMDEEYLYYHAPDLWYQVETEIEALIEQKELVEYWEKKTAPRKIRSKKILKGLPGRNNFGVPNKIEQKMFEAELRNSVEDGHRQRQLRDWT